MASELDRLQVYDMTHWWKIVLKVLWIFKNIFETLHDLNDSDEKTWMLKTALKNSLRVKSYSSFKIMQISI